VSIEKYLRNKCELDQRATFSQLINEVSKSLPEARRYKDDLREYGELRNAIVHNRGGGYTIAEPHSEVVESIEKIRDLIKKPPMVFPLFKINVLSFDVYDSIGNAVKIMTEDSFSQAPITNDGKIKALLTANTISRWLGSNVDEDIFSLKETTIGQVLKFTEDSENIHFVSRNTTLFKALEFFDDFEKRGKRLEALLITDSGNQNEKIIGIITIADFPKLLRGITFK
jgi:predicted transcriptional regulator